MIDMFSPLYLQCLSSTILLSLIVSKWISDELWPTVSHREGCGFHGDSWSDGWPVWINTDKGSTLWLNVPLRQCHQRFATKHWQRGQVPAVRLPGNQVSGHDFKNEKTKAKETQTLTQRRPDQLLPRHFSTGVLNLLWLNVLFWWTTNFWGQPSKITDRKIITWP